MSTILERERNLINAMRAQNFQPFFEGDKADAYYTIEKALKSMIEYQNCVIQQAAVLPILNFRYNTPEEIQDVRIRLDQNRRISHDAAIANLNMLNRICNGYQVEPIAPIDTSDRYAVADFIGELCGELYESGQNKNHIKTADQLYQHRKRRMDTYPTDDLSSKFGLEL